MICSSCKNQSSFDRCTNKALKGLILCGKHAKVRSPRIWKDLHELDNKAITIQKIWRGHSIRKRLKLAGPGVLNRSVCHNEEELVTLDDKNSVSPMNYFAFEENDKVYWFDIRSLLDNCVSSINPTNPYTRQQISIETRKRLREVTLLRENYKLENTHDTTKQKSRDEIIQDSWINVCQIIVENGFFEMSHLYFTSLNRTQLFIFINILKQDLVAWAAEHSNLASRRYRYIFWIKRLLNEYNKGIDATRLSFLTARILIGILDDSLNNYPVCFMAMSALHRL
jgi:hypothetical protein